jgi:hypothetical protein
MLNGDDGECLRGTKLCWSSGAKFGGS